MAAIPLYDTPLFFDSGLQAYWRFEGNSNDQKGSINGTDTGIAYGAGTGKFLQGANFSDAGDFIHFGNNLNQEYNTAFSYNIWYKGTFAGDGALMGKANNSSPYNGHFIELNGGVPAIFFCIANSFVATTHRIQVYKTTSTPFDGNWHMITCTYDGSTNASGALIYLDGTVLTDLSIIGDNLGNNSIATTANFQVNGRNGANYLCTGIADDASVFSRVLTPTEIANLYSGYDTLNLIDSFAESNFDSTLDAGDTINHAGGQSIVLPVNRTYTLNQLQFMLAKVGACTGNAYAKVYAATGTPGTDGAPTGSVLGTSDAVDTSKLSAGCRVPFNFSTPVVVSGGNVCVEMYFSGGNYGAGAYVGLGADGSSPSHAGNWYYRNSSDVVTAQSGTDAVFYLYGTSVLSATTDYLVFPRGRTRFPGSITGI